MELNAIRRIQIQASTSGVAEATNELNRMAAAQGGVAIQSEKTERSTASLARAFDNEAKRLDARYRLAEQVARSQKTLDAALAQNPALLERHASLTHLNNQRLADYDAAARKAGAANDNFAGKTKLSSFQLANLNAQLQDIAVGLGSGQSPFTVLLQQGSQLSQILSAKALIVGGAFALIAASAGTAVAAYKELERHNVTLTNALLATAGASGQSVAGLERITKSLAAPGTSSVADIRAAELELLKFRAVAGSTFEEVLKRAQDLSSTGFTDLKGAVQAFGKALNDPTKGLDGLRDAGLRITPVQEKLITDLQKQGQLHKAQTEILKIAESQLGGSTARAADTMSAAYGRFANQLMLGLEQLGKNVAEALRLKGAINGIADAMKEAMSDVERERQKFESALEQAGQGRMPGDKGSRLPLTPAAQVNLRFPAGMVEQNEAAVQAQQRIDAVRIALEKEAREAGFTEVALRTLHEAQKAGTEGNREGEAAIRGYVNAVMSAQATKQISDQLKQQAEGYRIEAATVGMSIAAAAAYRAEQDALFNAKLRGITLSEAQAAAIHKEAQAMGEAAQAAARASIQSQIKFDRATAFLTPEDVQIAQQLRGLYGDEVPAALGSTEAAAIRATNAMRGINDAGRDAFAGFVRGIAGGQNALDALIGSLDGMASKLTDMGSKNLFSGIMSGLSGGAFSFDPMSLAAGAVGIGLSFITSSMKKQEEQKKQLEAAQKQWADMQDEVIEFEDRMTTRTRGPMTQSLGACKETANDNADNPEKTVNAKEKNCDNDKLAAAA